MIEPYYKAEKLRCEKTDNFMWLMGSYVFEAISIALSNAFRKKGTQAKQFLDKPYSAIAREERGEMTQEEIVNKTEILFQMLTIKQKNFELEKKLKNPTTEAKA